VSDLGEIEMSKKALSAIVVAGLVILLATLVLVHIRTSTNWSLKASAERWEFLMRKLRR
jgi:hypothetical protein